MKRDECLQLLQKASATVNDGAFQREYAWAFYQITEAIGIDEWVQLILYDPVVRAEHRRIERRLKKLNLATDRQVCVCGCELDWHAAAGPCEKCKDCQSFRQ